MKYFFWNAIVGLFVGIVTLSAQVSDRWLDFRNQADDYYMVLEKTDMTNFSCYFTSSAYLNYVAQMGDSSYNYPLKFIWTREGNTYYILQPYPGMDDARKRQQSLQQIQIVKTEFQGFFLDFINFVVYSPFSDIPEDAEIEFSQDSVRVHYRSGEGNLVADVWKVFLPSGKLRKVRYESGDKRIINYPAYTEVEGKWLCVGWDSQIYQNGKITSGSATRTEFRKIDRYWVPVRVMTMVQVADRPEERYMSELFIKDYLFNIPLEKIPDARTGNSTNPAENQLPKK